MLPDSLKNAPCVLHGARFDVHAIEVMGKDGLPKRREVIVHPGAVAILPMLDADTVVLIRSYRPTVGEELWELPAGTLEPPESPAACARRELVEETGYRAGKLTPLTEFYASPGILTEKMHAFLATQLTQVGQDLDDGERITPHALPLVEAIEMIRRREIHDAKSIAVLLFYRTFRPPDQG
jgi:ADP-ribose pyrophosphatase